MAAQVGSATETVADGPAEIHRRLVAHFDDILASRFDDALSLIDPDVVDHRGGLEGDHLGLDAWRQKWERASDNGFHDLPVTIEQNVESGDASVNRYTIRGTHTASGRRYEVFGLDMIRVRSGKLVEHWALLDVDAMRDQLGLTGGV